MKSNVIKLACILAVTFTSQAFATTIVIRKVGGGTNGYNSVRETHGDGDNRLTCLDPGNTACVWSVKPYVVTSITEYDIDVLAAGVEAKIANSSSGSFELDGELVVSWENGVDADNYDMEVNDKISN